MPDRALIASIIGATTAAWAAMSPRRGRAKSERTDDRAWSARCRAEGSWWRQARGLHQGTGVAGAGVRDAPSCDGDQAGAVSAGRPCLLFQVPSRNAAETTWEATVPHAAPAAPRWSGPTRIRSSSRLAAAANGTAIMGDFESRWAMKPAWSTMATKAAGYPRARIDVYCTAPARATASGAAPIMSFIIGAAHAARPIAMPTPMARADVKLVATTRSAEAVLPSASSFAVREVQATPSAEQR
mmetsp:Transcript_5247/g.17433  ORF Transcript_5247/g.17433 Transcript_5247/m.17433 type:complete len:242 (+) Transcript_5247:293-1018(+)